ncbi:LysR family transcriptional regulator [Sphingomonas sp.]|uniref:LysR family transcriptional regulator n=1 Tax=Sphingomonas sp. TaxID=28214 RepID=UPI003B3B8685
MAEAFDLNFRHLRALAAIAEAGNISAASRLVGLSQPALTQGLAKLEHQFGAALFERRPQGMAQTAAGQAVLVRVQRAFERFSRALRSGRANRADNRLTGAQVRAVLSLAEAGSFVGAAEAVGLSEPALHRAVKDLEALCALPLVERRGRGVGLTGAGRRVARALALGVAELTAALEESADRGGRLAIGAMALSRSLLLPATLAALAQKAPAAAIDVVEGSYLELVEALRDGSIDILIGALREHPERDLVQEPLFTDRLTIIGRAGHPLAARRAGYQDLAAYPWIVARRASGLLDRWQELFDKARMPRPHAPIHCGSVALIRGVLLRSDFLTLLSPDQVRAEIDAGLLAELGSEIPDTARTIGAITRRDWYPTELQRQFLTELREVARDRERNSEI